VKGIILDLVACPTMKKVREIRNWKKKKKLELGNFQKQKSHGSYSSNISKKSKADGGRVRQFSRNQMLAELELEIFSKMGSQ